MKPNNSQKYVSQFIGVVNYYPNMCPRSPHTLAPLTKITSYNINKRIKIEQYDFDGIRRIVFRDTLLTNPDYNETFKIHNDAREFQLGAVVSQKGKLIAFI